MLCKYYIHIAAFQDNCSIHTAHIVRRWFADQQNIELLEWPSKGCDMNPIENCWGLIVNAWEQGQERTRRQLVEHAMQEWELFRRHPHIVQNIVASMPNRLQDVIASEGGWTKY